MKKLNILLTGLLIIGFSSCKDFLDVTPTNQGDSADAIKTPADAQVIINGMMRNMTSSSYYGRDFIMYGDAKGGDMTIISQGRGLDQLYNFTHQATTNSYSGFWSQIYFCILQANTLLKNISALDPSGTNATFNNYKGQALTARALMYFDLVRLYGKSYDDDKASYGVPNITAPLLPFDQPGRASVEQNYTQILNDLKAAAPLMVKTKTNGYLNYWANLAIQARVYLYMKDYTNSLKAAEEIITSTVYPASALYTNTNWTTSWTTQFNTESIFELGIFPSEGDLGTASLGAYTRNKGAGSTAILGYYYASTPFLNRLNQDAADVRWGVMGRDESSATRLGALYKYSGNTALAGDGKGTGGTAVNIKVIRLSEIYLIAAEAAFPTDKLKSANYLQAIRKRAPNLTPATALNVTMDMILEERSKELYGEGQRFFDMIRLNKSITFDDAFGNLAVVNRPGTIDRTFFKTRLPIPSAELEANATLKPQQNQGYN
ncbi:MAG: RagB/SusD family nutrient uptake outer membrane protein [Pedobacter sp.]|nr:RagB/SusD family nutrient uptake outer membrane protein [Pedobacter sp.]MDQ8054339.1 RagB/SusD family nutrient uptake outer membrane protein [Pedobacter sp.]